MCEPTKARFSTILTSDFYLIQKDLSGIENVFLMKFLKKLEIHADIARVKNSKKKKNNSKKKSNFKVGNIWLKKDKPKFSKRRRNCLFLF